MRSTLLLLRALLILGTLPGCGSRSSPLCWDVGDAYAESAPAGAPDPASLRAAFADVALDVVWEGPFVDSVDWPLEVRISFSDLDADRWHRGDELCPAGGYVRGTMTLTGGDLDAAGRSVGVVPERPGGLDRRIPWAVLTLEPWSSLERAVLADRDAGFVISEREVFLSSRDRDDVAISVFVDGTEPSGAQTRVIAARATATPR